MPPGGENRTAATWWPRITARRTEPEPDSQHVAPAQRRMNIVIIDDTSSNIKLMRAMVSRLDDCATVGFTDPGEGLAWCLTREPDLVIVDFMMPGLDGIELTQHLRRVPVTAEIPVLMVTAAHEKDVRYRALESGVTDFLTKPLDTLELVSRLRNMLALRKSHLALAERAESLAAEVRKAMADVHERERETILRLARAAEFRDPGTGAHILRMTGYSQLIALRLGLSDHDQEMMRQAAPMHDVGKLGTPDQILLKPGPLTAQEFESMKRHSAVGYEILKDSASPVLQMAAQIALSHHERFDGGGYPGGLAGEAIPLPGRMVAVADVFDALTSDRPYKRAWQIERAADFLRQGRSTHFDPDCVDAFLSEWATVIAIRERYHDDEAVSW
jgi:response regulator RpfG family c-di-GMP phosphodiesterase